MSVLILRSVLTIWRVTSHRRSRCHCSPTRTATTVFFRYPRYFEYFWANIEKIIPYRYYIDTELKLFMKHVFNIRHQFHNFHQSLKNLRENEFVVVVDFSENYNCKYFEEIQAHHFNSRNQISLHTVMVYTHEAENKYKAHSFCTISSSNCHQPAAIWAHLEPILEWIKLNYGSVNTVHFFSDGPSTQYRQKQNLYLLCTRFFDFGFDRTTWSFFEAGHGKGPADGVGGFIKRTADKIVARGKDIPDANTFFESLKSVSKIALFLIEQERIAEFQEILPKSIPRLIGTLQVHQVYTENRNSLMYRNLSCFCESAKRGFCQCLNPKLYKVDGIECLAQESSDDDIPLSTLASDNNKSLPPQRRNSLDKQAPLDSTAVFKELQNLPSRKNIYKAVYGSSSDTGDEYEKELIQSTHNKDNVLQVSVFNFCLSLDDYICEQPGQSTSYQNDNKLDVSVGDFLHVNVHTQSTKKTTTYSYVCKALSRIEDDCEIKVMFLRVVDKNAKRFRLDETDISYVNYEDIIKVLPKPESIKRGHIFYYQFKNSIDIFEK